MNHESKPTSSKATSFLLKTLCTCTIFTFPTTTTRDANIHTPIAYPWLFFLLNGRALNWATMLGEIPPEIQRQATAACQPLTPLEAAHVSNSLARTLGSRVGHPFSFSPQCLAVLLQAPHMLRGAAHTTWADQQMPFPWRPARFQVYAILKQTQEKLGLVGVITVDPKVQAQELTQSVGEEITRMISEQKKLEERFEELVGLQHVLRHQPNKTKLVENQVRAQGLVEARRMHAWGPGRAHGRACTCMPMHGSV